MNPEETKPEMYPVIMKHLPPKFVKKAEMELFETQETINLRVKEVKNILSKASDIKLDWFSDEDIIMYLRILKYDVEKAVKAMKKLVAFIKKQPKLFEPIDRKILEDVFRKDVFCFLPYRTEDGIVIGLAKLSSWEPSEICLDDVCKCSCLVNQYCMTLPMSQLNGAMLIYDFKASFWKYVKHYTPFNAYLMLQIIFECIPLRLKAVHMVNVNGLAKLMIPLIRPFLSEKLNKRIFIHDDPYDLRNFIDEDLLPSEYGGKLSKQERGDLIDISKITMPDHVIKILNHVKSANYS